MTKQSIVSILKDISDSYRTDTNDTVTMFHINGTEKCFSVRIADGSIYCGSIYCDCIRINDRDLIQFINNGKIISIFDYLCVKEIELLYL